MVKQVLTDFQAATPFMIEQASRISDDDVTLLFNLYLPFLGPKAYALYQFLYEEQKDQRGQTAFKNHYLLLDSLALSSPEFIRARQALEALSLLKTYAGERMGQPQLRYVLQRPMTAEAFFNEDLLSGLLFHYVGEERFLVLAKRYQAKRGAPLQQQKELSASFLSIFDLPDTQHKPNVAIEDAKTVAPKADFDQVSFDFEGMAALVHGTTTEKVQKVRELILTQQVLYGLNEAEMATALTRSINLDDHEVNKQAFLAYLASTWSNRKQKQQLADQGAERSVTAKTVASEEPTAKTGNRALDALYQAANNLSPIDFISQIKEQNAGYVTQNERRILNDLLEKRILPVPAINLLTYQVLVNMDQSDLKRNLVDAIANSWAKAGVRTAEDAVAAIKAHKDKSRQKATGRTSTWSRSANKQEPTFTSNEAAKKQQVDQAAVKQALDLMKNYKTKD
ncbi:DnaD domain protein [Fructobacillus fructosus]|uniref:Replication initiation and membrane attachment protein DnaB (DnaB2) n=1 Tax=Fructobacillus fructosus TaxID=1631 RepID=A0ABN9YT13_9LACO|nr:DnaD domain protein [Fructobacillus fructosus]MBC9118554.1 DnaD domain protein [Fructobacillus fructosus]MBD9365031.1 DnaD domain protein [Leuconostoc mesenteroides]CAK1231730.1 Replication initiation and membrane attachment protein DnaB (DnaB2) [Fructobacillus fructosus]CAK1243644.1 Replication initiation and membrane attachment protein DnaB (DnaB2) [Fructobacillus fructosus]